MPVFEVKDLNIGFEEKSLIPNLSFRVQGPAFVAVIGHNGCGKSTFFRSLVNQQPYSGQVYLNDVNLLTIKDLPTKGLITLLEQKNNINFNIPVLDLILMGRFRFKKLFQDYTKEDISEVSNALKTLQISHLAEKDFLNLSGGEQQLVWLAQIMVQDTEMILLDEPSQQLDVYNRKKIFDLMQYLAYVKGKIVFCITHDLGNLHDTQGYYLNLSRSTPNLSIINSEAINAEINFLEQRRLN